MFIPLWCLFLVGFLLVVAGMGVYSLGSQNGYQAGLRAFYMVKELNELARVEDAV